jgi:hypothetical protein
MLQQDRNLTSSSSGITLYPITMAAFPMSFVVIKLSLPMTLTPRSLTSLIFNVALQLTAKRGANMLRNNPDILEERKQGVENAEHKTKQRSRMLAHRTRNTTTPCDIVVIGRAPSFSFSSVHLAQDI